MMEFKKKEQSNELDMTPMVDVTFLLLIFFMVTASFMVQRSMEQSHADVPSVTPVNWESDQLTVFVDAEDRVSVEGYECGSDREIRAVIRDAVQAGPDSMVIRAHEDSTHAKVIRVWDAGVGAGIADISLKTTREDF